MWANGCLIESIVLGTTRVLCWCVCVDSPKVLTQTFCIIDRGKKNKTNTTNNQPRSLANNLGNGSIGRRTPNLARRTGRAHCRLSVPPSPQRMSVGSHRLLPLIDFKTLRSTPAREEGDCSCVHRDVRLPRRPPPSPARFAANPHGGLRAAPFNRAQTFGRTKKKFVKGPIPHAIGRARGIWDRPVGRWEGGLDRRRALARISTESGMLLFVRVSLPDPPGKRALRPTAHDVRLLA